MAHWITFFRGLFAVGLGIALIFQPDMARPLLGNFMGAFWFTGGLLTVRWGLATKHSRAITIVVGVLGVLAGLTTLSRTVVIRWIDPDFVVTALGIIIVLTGILHVSGRMPVRHGPVGKWTRSGLLLGIFEIVLGLVLIFDGNIGPIVNLLALIWAFLGGAMLIYDAWQIRQEAISQLEERGNENI